jgi:tetratricopeptide (TPR) repeat protein
VILRQQPLILPTYEIGAPEPHPVFFTGRVYQGAQGHIYPYPLYDVLTDRKADKSYKALYLENEYVNVCVLPEIGGRIHSATDKTNGYEMFYRQTGVKPALIGMLGAWLSGGVEWNFPHHHRPSSYLPIDWTTEENSDGSKTVWVGETELRHRLKWSVGLTVYPGRSWVEARVRIFNRTPFIQSMLYWANVSVHANEHYEVIFPPSTQFGTDHSKVVFTPWPFGEAAFGSGESVNLAWWKNFTVSSRSIFAWNFEDDFLAGYDHGKEAGSVHVANHHIVGGKKFFLWGNNPGGEMWKGMLSDADGHYLELMVGAYSDNQPDYSWIGPGETREFTQRWYPLRGIRSVKNATRDAAVNLERVAPDTLFLGFCASGKFPGARVRLIRDGGETLLEEVTEIDPSRPFIRTLGISPQTPDTALLAVLTDAQGNELVSYRPVLLGPKPMPQAVEATLAAEDYSSVEELYLAGLRLEQFHNARLDPMRFYDEALRRDSGNSRVHTVVGLGHARRGAWDLAEKHLRLALERPARGYTTVKDPEAYYYLGLVYRMQGRLGEATDAYWKATWYPTFRHPAYFALARIAALTGDYPRALELVTEALYVGARNTKALTLKAWLLRKTGQGKEAAGVLDEVLALDPLDYWSLSEQSILEGRGAGFLARAVERRGEGLVGLQELLEVASDYGEIGAWSEASDLLSEAVGLGEPYAGSPLVHYYNGFYLLQTGDTARAGEVFRRAALCPLDLCFPFRTEELAILGAALAFHPSDAVGHYCLGNLLYYLDHRDEALGSWERAARADPLLARAHRNLGFGYGQRGETSRAIAALERSLEVDPTAPRVLWELDRLYEQAARPLSMRLAFLEKHRATALAHDDAVLRLLALYNATGAPDKGIRILDRRHFHVWEGGGQVHSLYVDAHLLKGLSLARAGNYAAAIRSFDRADLYPENLEVGRPFGGGHSAKGFYFLGRTYRRLGQGEKAKACFETSSRAAGFRGGGRGAPVSEEACFRALSLCELGRAAAADSLLGSLKDGIARQLSSPSLVDEYAKFGSEGSHSESLAQLSYLSALLALAEGDRDKAGESLALALRMNPNHLWAKQLTLGLPF